MGRQEECCEALKRKENPGLKKTLFCPESIAIVGASIDLSRVNGRPLKYLLAHGYKGNIFPVNPNHEEIEGLRCYPDLSAIPEHVDVALILVAAKYVLNVIKQCAKKGVKGVVIFASGFAEMGTEGKRRQEEISDFAKGNGISVVGPNSAGFVNFHENIACSFSAALESSTLLKGSVGFVTQSGAFGGCLVDRGLDMGIGFSYFVSTGNEAGLDVLDCAEFMLHDSNTDVVAGFIEGFEDGVRFVDVADLAIKKKKPLIFYKVGRSKVSENVTMSHTGKLTGSDVFYDAAFKQNGVIRVDDPHDILEVASLFTKCKLPEGERIGIVSTTGGGAGVVVDECAQVGLMAAPFQEETKRELAKKLPGFIVPGNPVDVTSYAINNPNVFRDILSLLVNDKGLDLIIVIISMASSSIAERLGRDLLAVHEYSEKPVITVWLAGELSDPGIEIIKGAIPVFRRVDTCVKSIRTFLDYGRFLMDHCNL